MPRPLTPAHAHLLFVAGIMTGGLTAESFIPTELMASVGWFIVFIAVMVIAAVVWHTVLSLWYKRSRISTKWWRFWVLILSPAIPYAGFRVVPMLLAPEGGHLVEAMATVGIEIGRSLALSCFLWGFWRLLLWWDGRQRGQTTD